jgi:hydroxymethylbilane synthase
MEAVVKIGTRGSPLALAQAHETRNRLAAAHKHLAAEGAIEIIVMRTTGDRIQSGPLSEAGGKGLFTKEIEDALLDRSIHIAVHSMKDVPTVLPDGLIIECILPREDPRDALLTPGLNKDAASLADLPRGAVVGTASLRRKAILLNRRPDLNIITFRGNVDTRIRKLADGEADATLLGYAGLRRLGKAEQASSILTPEEMLPAVCQGAIGIECRVDDDNARAMLAAIHHGPSGLRANAERALLSGLDGSCRTPIAALAEIEGDTLTLRALIARPDGSEMLETARSGPVFDGIALGHDAADELKSRGGSDFFDPTATD